MNEIEKAPTQKTANILQSRREEKVQHLRLTVRQLESFMEKVIALKEVDRETERDSSNVHETLDRSLNAAQKIDEQVQDEDSHLDAIRKKYRKE